MSFIVNVIVFFIASLVGIGAAGGAFHLLTRNLGPSAIGALMFWPVWLLIYLCAGATILYGFST
jgi:hypothetical protein